MGTTTNNGWTYPESTDLVKDGATAIETLATNIDTTLGVYATPMGVHLSTVSFSAVASQSINDVFSATYDNYKILMNFTSSGQAAINMRLRVSGSDNSTSNYHNHWQATSTSENTYSGNSEVSQTSFRVSSSSGTTSIKSLSFDFFAPFLSDRTMYLGLQNFSNTDKANGYAGGVQHGAFNDSTSFTGFTVIASSGSLTGSISVYAYNK
jgi:hypothetical protein